jgi:hypothetical protein
MLGLRLAALSVALLAPTGELPPEIASAYGTIRGDRILPNVRFLASPRLEGRESGTRGCEVAADFLSSAYQAAGLAPGSKEGYLQSYDLVRRTLGRDAELTVKRNVAGASAARALAVRTEWLPFGFSEVGTVEAPVVFAGYGIVAKEFGWDDYASLPPGGVKGKIVLVFRHEPDENGTAGSKFFDGREMTLHASLRQKAREAAARGALGLIVVDDPGNHDAAAAPSSSLSRWTIPTEEERKLAKDDPKRPRGRPTIQRDDEPLGLLAALASQEILRVLDAGRDWSATQQEMDASRKPKAFAVPNITVKMVHAFDVERDPTANVLAVLPGSDPVLSKEYVLIGGHYDHVGKSETTGEIHPGADDNASGTAAVLAVAQAFAALPKAPARRLLFASWSGEEMGLLGSERFVRKPAIPLDRIVAAINLDMVGRNKEGEISVVGRTETPDLVALFERFAPQVGFALNDDAGAGAGRSDNGSLWLGGIPTASLFSGTHEDYHQPEDTWDKVLPEKVARAARLSFLVAYEVASGKSTPKRLDVPTGPWKPLAPAVSTKEQK